MSDPIPLLHRAKLWLLVWHAAILRFWSWQKAFHPPSPTEWEACCSHIGFSCVVISFLCVWESKEGGKKRERKRVEEGRALMGIESLHRRRIRERNGWFTCWEMTEPRLSRSSGRLNIFKAVLQHLPRSKRDLICNSISTSKLFFHVSSWDFFLRGVRLMRWCFAWFLRCALAYMPESRSFIPAGGLCLSSTSPLQITVGWTPSRTTGDGFSQCRIIMWLETYLQEELSSKLWKSTSPVYCPPCYLWIFSSEALRSVSESRVDGHAAKSDCD